MTNAKTVPNIVLGLDENAVTVYTTSCEKIYSKKSSTITPPQSTANRTLGPKDTKIIDLLRVEIRYTVRGVIDSADEAKLQTLLTTGGVFNMNYKSENFNVNFDKLTITNNNNTENDETDVFFTVIVGVNF